MRNDIDSYFTYVGMEFEKSVTCYERQKGKTIKMFHVSCCLSTRKTLRKKIINLIWYCVIQWIYVCIFDDDGAVVQMMFLKLLETLDMNKTKSKYFHIIKHFF